jgi:signal peptide peptidase SppA
MSHFFLNERHAEMFTPRALRIASHPSAARMDAAKLHATAGECGDGMLEYDIRGGVAVIDINGSIVTAKIPLWFFYGDVTYESIVDAVEAAVEDKDVHAVLLRFNSPGGTVTGCAEAAAKLNRLANDGGKPVVAHCQMADSAAYWLASTANEIFVDPTGEVGSIGVICVHWDYSKLFEKAGVAATPIFAGDHKADGHPYAPLDKDAKARIQAEMDYLRDIFVTTVADHRALQTDSVRETQALTYIGQLGVDAGLADDVGYADDVLQTLIDLKSQP